MNKIILGTAQFGMAYGINNKRGSIPKEEVFEILDEASRSGIKTLDTAYSYGDSEMVIGEYIRNNGKNFRVISKLPKCDIGEVRGFVDTSLEKLSIGKLYGYLIHDFESFRAKPGVWDALAQLKSEGRVEKIGFSLYYPSELDHVLKNRVEIDMIQVPYSIFDQRFGPYFAELHKSGVEVHGRSVFLQGLVFKTPAELNGRFAGIKDRIERLHSISRERNVPLVSICLNFVMLNRYLHGVVVGIDGILNLKQIMGSSRCLGLVEDMLTDLAGMRETDERLILPINWQTNKVKAQ